MRRALLLALMVLAPFATAAEAQTAALEKPVVKLGIGGKIQLPYLAVNIAQERGYFKEQGLTVEFNEFKGRLGFAESAGRWQRRFHRRAYEHTNVSTGPGRNDHLDRAAE